MGLFAWTIQTMWTPKFWKLIKKDGFLNTYVRAFRSHLSPHYLGGVNGPAKCQGQDQFGNKYYEDFDVHHVNHRRWVEYSDYNENIWNNGDRIPPAWHGWLSYQYDDVPSRSGPQHFVNHHYIQPHTLNLSRTPLHHQPPAAVSNPNRLSYIQYHRNRKAEPWKGQRIESRYIDPMASQE